MKLSTITGYLDSLLEVDDFPKDGSNNGLQIEACDDVKKIGFAVDASKALFDAAAEQDCDLLFVHHGLSWGDNLKRIVGIDASRIGTLFGNGISLYAAHLPLDGHPEVGHNAVIAQRLGLTDVTPFAKYAGKEIGCFGKFVEPTTISELMAQVDKELDTTCTLALPAEDDRPVSTVAIVSGGGTGCFRDAAWLGVDAFLTGEYAHQHYHDILEADIPLIAGGHYKTECPGVEAVMDLVKEAFDVECTFIDLPTGL
jgi:dinuclear metal center YbgI/SA1388 family protein